MLIKSPIIIPKGYRLIIKKGQNIDLVNEAFILSYSPVDISGTEEDPVVIKSSDNSGQGMAIVKCKLLIQLFTTRFLTAFPHRGADFGK